MRAWLRSLGPYALSIAIHGVVGIALAAGALFVARTVIAPAPIPVELVVRPAPREEPAEEAPRERSAASRPRAPAPPLPVARPRPRRVKVLAEVPRISAPDPKLERLALAPTPS